MVNVMGTKTIITTKRITIKSTSKNRAKTLSLKNRFFSNSLQRFCALLL